MVLAGPVDHANQPSRFRRRIFEQAIDLSDLERRWVARLFMQTQYRIFLAMAVTR